MSMRSCTSGPSFVFSHASLRGHSVATSSAMKVSHRQRGRPSLQQMGRLCSMLSNKRRSHAARRGMKTVTSWHR